MIRLLDEERAVVYQYIRSLCGITLDDSKAYLVEGRLAGIAGGLGCTSLSELIARARCDPGRSLERSIIDAITTNETSFFRDGAPFDLLRYKIIPELMDRRARSASARIRIWSAACSTGQELYSIAIVLKELLGDPDRYGVELIGSDISDDALAHASRGVFTSVEISRGLDQRMRDRYFYERAGGWQVRDELRALVSLRKQNLMRDFSGLGRFDVIFCRNVAIYFNEADRRLLFSRMERALEIGGSLIVGAMETLTGIAPQFESKRYLRTLFYQARSAPPVHI